MVNRSLSCTNSSPRFSLKARRKLIWLCSFLLLTGLSTAVYAQTPSYPAPAPPPSYPNQGAPQYPPSPYGAPAQYPGQVSQPYPPPSPYPPPNQQPVLQSPPQLDQLVARIALYPDPLLAQTMTAATFWNDIPQAAAWADQHSYLTGDALAQAIQQDQLPWDPSILGLLPFPSVLDAMAQDPAWTAQLGQAVLAQRADVMDAVQRERAQAQRYGYLAPNEYDNVVTEGGYIQIVPVNPAFLYVPVYNPAVVFYAPRPGFFVGGAIHFGPRIVIGASFGTFGWWAGPGFAWGAHGILIGGHAWDRNWGNRAAYVHPYARGGYVHPAGPRVERHDFGHGRPPR